MQEFIFEIIDFVLTPIDRFLRKTLKFSNKGSALVIALMVSTVMVGIGISVSRLTLSQIRQSTQLIDSQKAYYAAESGIEQGLLMWRYNRNVQVPIEDATVGVDETTTNAIRVNINTMTMNLQQNYLDTTNLPTVSNNSYFDLKIWYKNPLINNISKEVVCNSTALKETTNICYAAQQELRPIVETINNPALAQDQAVEYDVTGLTSVRLQWDYIDQNICPPLNNNPNSPCKLQVIQIDNSGNTHQNFYYTIYNGTTIDLVNIKTLRIRSFGGSLKDYSLTAPFGQKMSSRVSTIQAYGYYGNAKRRLQIKVDRSSGAVLGPFDFTIFTQNVTAPTSSPSPTPSPSPTNSPTTDHLVAYYNFDETEGSILYNNAGSCSSRCQGTLHNFPDLNGRDKTDSGWTSTNQYGGGALRFNGNNPNGTFVEIPNQNDINFSKDQDFTISFYTIADPTQADTTNDDNSIVEKWGTPYLGYPYVARYLNQNTNTIL